MSQAPPVDPASAAGNPHPDSTDPAARRPPSRSAEVLGVQEVVDRLTVRGGRS